MMRLKYTEVINWEREQYEQHVSLCLAVLNYGTP